MGVMSVYGMPVTSSVTGSYWPAKDVGFCSEELKRVKRERTQGGGRKENGEKKPQKNKRGTW